MSDVRAKNLAERMKMSTHFNRKHFDEWVEAANRGWADLDRDARRAAHKCRWCFYAMRNGVAGAAITHKNCESCDAAMTFSSTATDALCEACSERLGLCVKCCADIDLIDRRKLERVKR